MFVYVESRNEGENGESLFTVGFYKPDGKWNSICDYWNEEEAADRCHYLNGGNKK